LLEETILDTSWSKADIHIHTAHSDGIAGVAAILEHVVQATDLRLIAITDHDTVAGAFEARRLARAFGIEVVIGEEVSTAEGHLLALFIERWLPPGRPAAETIAAVHAQGGLCIPAHPFDALVPSMGHAGLGRRCAGPRAGEWPVDGVEVFNATLLWRNSNRQAGAVSAALGLAPCGGSDAHSLATVGRGYTVFPGTSADDLYRAIQRGQTQAGGRHWRLHHFLAVGAHRIRERWRRRRGQVALLPVVDPGLDREPLFGVEPALGLEP
jgi:predicted metal-dependent phosphoesterase TrpH